MDFAQDAAGHVSWFRMMVFATKAKEERNRPMIKPDLQALDDKVWRNRDVKAELAYCGTYMKHRKSITNLDLRFYAWLFRAALKRIEELEPKTAK